MRIYKSEIFYTYESENVFTAKTCFIFIVHLKYQTEAHDEVYTFRTEQSWIMGQPQPHERIQRGGGGQGVRTPPPGYITKLIKWRVAAALIVLFGSFICLPPFIKLKKKLSN